MSPNFPPVIGATSFSASPFAVSFVTQTGLAFTFLHNPTGSQHSYPEIQASTASLDGVILYQWTRDLRTISLDGIITEGIEQWQMFQTNFLNTVCRYNNNISQETLWVSIQKIVLNFGKGMPFTATYSISLVEAAPVNTEGAYNPNVIKGAQ